MAIENCPHGHQTTPRTVLDDDGYTGCCGSLTSTSVNGNQYCRCCFAAVTAFVTMPAVQMQLEFGPPNSSGTVSPTDFGFDPF